MSHHSNSRLMKLDRALDKCPRCAHTPMVIDAAGGELFCSNCGFVLKEKMEEVGPEWRSFSNEEKDEKSRVGLPTSVAISDMGQAQPGARVGRQEPETGVQRVTQVRGQAHSK